MYCKLFASLYQGTLRGKSHEILVFTNLLANCDAHGIVDKHWKAIAEEVGLTVDEVKASITALESPDPESRSPENMGIRLQRLDGHRSWGWKITNYEKYRSIRNEEDRREQNRLAQQRFRENSKPPSAEVSRGKPMSSQEEGEVEVKEKKKASSPLSEQEFVEALKANPAYKTLDIDGELAKMDAWLLTRPSRKKTRRFVIQWLNRIDVPLSTSPKSKVWSSGQTPSTPQLTIPL